MAQPVLVRAYTGKGNSGSSSNVPFTRSNRAQALPPVSAYAFADILRSADGPELQTAIDGIAEIAAKNRMSLADEYASHLPPLGEITAATSSAMRPHLLRPGGGPRRALTSVPEASSGSSEGSRTSKKRGSMFTFRKQQAQDSSKPMRRIRIGSMGRTVPIGTTTALAAEHRSLPAHTRSASESTVTGLPVTSPPQRTSSAAQSSLQRLLAANQAGRGA